MPSTSTSDSSEPQAAGTTDFAAELEAFQKSIAPGLAAMGVRAAADW